jgi:hypothetical protein
MRPEPEEAEPSEFYQVVWGFGGAVDAQFRRAVTGDREGRLRRPLLFVIVGLALVLNLPAVGLVAVLILAYTDQVTVL